MEIKNPMEQYLDVHRNIYALCMFLKEKIFNNDLPPFVLTLNPDARDSTYGWCWDGIWAVESTGQKFCEVNICSQHLSRPFEEVAETVLHELVHLYANYKHIEDTNKTGKYHRRTYKELGERFGLIVEHSGSYHGWSKTSLKEETKVLLEQFENRNVQLICDTRNLRRKTTVKKPPAPSKTYTCSCGQTFRSKKVLDLVCGKCNKKFIVEEE